MPPRARDYLYLNLTTSPDFNVGCDFLKSLQVLEGNSLLPFECLYKSMSVITLLASINILT